MSLTLRYPRKSNRSENRTVPQGGARQRAQEDLGGSRDVSGGCSRPDAASRPIRVNEIASLARIYGVAGSILLDETDIGAAVHERVLGA